MNAKIKDERRIVGLRTLCEKYQVDQKTVRATIARFEDFPIIKLGKQGREWQLDLDKIDQWLLTNDWWRGTRSPSPRPKKGREVEVAEEEIPDSVKKLREGFKKTDAKNEVQTKLLQLEYDKKRGLLVDREEVVTLLSTKMARFAKAHEMLPNLIGKKFGLSDELIRNIRDYLDEARNALVREDFGFFSKMNEASE